MSCNGCRVLRKGCNEDCMLRHCLMWIQNPQAQAHATLFVAKFFGRAVLMSFLYSVPTNQRSALFQSLLYEAVGRTINPVNGAVGLLWTANWHLCQLAVEQVLRGGGVALAPLPHLFGAVPHETEAFEDCCSNHHQQVIMGVSGSRMLKRKVGFDGVKNDFEAQVVSDGRGLQAKKQRAGIPNEESETTTLGSSSLVGSCASQKERKLLTLFF